MAMPRISIISPVYNVEKYLPTCLDSILAQDFQEWEALCVDDGSQDGSAGILAHYAVDDSRIHALHQAHAGPGVARNRALQQAQGEFLCFVDSDDQLARQDALSFMTEAMVADELDILCFGADVKFETSRVRDIRYRETQCLNVRQTHGIFPAGTEFFRSLVVAGDFLPYVWLYCIRRTFLKREDLSFLGIFRAEDSEFIFRALLMAGRVRHTTRKICQRNVREGSLMTKPETFHFVEDAVMAWQSMMDFLVGHSFSLAVREAILLHLARQAQEIGRRFHALDSAEQNRKASLSPALRSCVNVVLALMPMFRRHMASYRFPFHLFQRGDRVVIYGAGNVGREFYAQTVDSDYVQCAGVLDRRADALKLEDLPVKSPHVIRGMAYDVVLIAIEDEALAQSARKDLLALGVEDDRIVWDGPHYLERAFYRGVYFPLLDRLGGSNRYGNGVVPS